MLSLFRIWRINPPAIRDDHFQPLAGPTRTWSRDAWRLTTVVLTFFAAFTLLSERASSQPLASSKDRFLGAGTSSPVGRFFSKYWNQVTPGNAGKWGSVSFAQGQYNWTNLDPIYNFAIQNGLLYKHHTLVWGSQQPGWITALDTSAQRAAVEDWIKSVGQRYPKMDFVDVVNEPLHTPLPSYKDALGGDGLTGWDWVIKAFQWARQYCPGVKLILNEYNVLGNTTSANNYLIIINLLKARNLIDGIGVQGHYFEFRSHIGATTGSYVYDLNTIKSNLNQLTATGIPVYISEFDIDEPIDSNQVAEYKIYFPILWDNPGVKGITFWGYIQDDVWSSYPNTYLLDYTGRERPVVPWLRTYVSSPLPPTLIAPFAQIGIRNPWLVWQSAATATSYHVQVSASSTFNGFLVDTTVTDTTLHLAPLAAGTRCFWRVSGINQYGASNYSTVAAFVTGDLISGVEAIQSIPTDFGLSQNYPNPFNPTTSFEFRLPAGQAGVSSSEFISLKVVDVLGREVATLVNEHRQPGIYTVRWDASGFPSGVYFCRMQAGGFVETKKMVLAK
ncbi:MAG: endo-1,4-beta-xylanase [Ignavibacteriales bacterium]|nr:endo-1,4-beta-xylanase [Ignavibacteriales bacterium]